MLQIHQPIEADQRLRDRTHGLLCGEHLEKLLCSLRRFESVGMISMLSSFLCLDTAYHVVEGILNSFGRASTNAPYMRLTKCLPF